VTTFRADRRQKQLRAALFAFAGLLALQSAWIALPELIRPSPLAFPHDTRNLQISSSEQKRASWAAKLAIVRGDLWTEAAIEQSTELIRDVESRRADQAELARATAEKAATLSPHDSRVWLMLAGLDCLRHREVSGTLKMSYYTGPNEIVLMPPRLHIATCSDAINDAELQTLVASEIRLIISHEQNLKPVIVAAYQDASPSGKRFIETVVGDLDPGLMATIRVNKGTE
jgi:hypothetical protein